MLESHTEADGEVQASQVIHIYGIFKNIGSNCGRFGSNNGVCPGVLQKIFFDRLVACIALTISKISKVHLILKMSLSVFCYYPQNIKLMWLEYQQQNSAAQMPSQVVSSVELVLDSSDKLVERKRLPGENKVCFRLGVFSNYIFEMKNYFFLSS